RLIAERDAEGIAESLLERRDARIGHSSRIAVEAVVRHTAELAAELDDVAAAKVRRRVAGRERRDDAPARESGRTADVQAGDGVALSVGLLPDVALVGVVPMQIVALFQVVPDVQRVLIEVDGRDS